MAARLLYLLLFIGLSHAAIGQGGAIRGRVLDQRTGKPLPFANVYISYTTVGTQTDELGDFILKKLTPGKYDLVASYVGHAPFEQNVTVTDSVDVELTIELFPIALKTVEVNASKDVKWNKDLEKFQRLFIGDKKDIQRVKLLNPWVLEFAEPRPGYFSASASDVLKIENLKLGYHAYFELRNFLFGPSTYLISGPVRFVEMITKDSTVRKYWMENRMHAYDGSARHLLKAMIDGKVREEGFVIFNDVSNLNHVVRATSFYENLNKNIFFYDYTEQVKPGRYAESYLVRLPKRLEIHYLRENIPGKVYRDIPHPISWIEVDDRDVAVKKSGVLIEPRKVVLSGAMSTSRVADILPFDYEPPHDRRAIFSTAAYEPVKALMTLVERPYIQTDKSYYYPGENIWFKSYINYYSRTLKDSLSRVLFVEFVNKDKTVLGRKTLSIINGQASGNILLENIIPPGDYQLRAYTRWMLNFDSTLVYAKPIKILSNYEYASNSNYTFTDEKNFLNISLSTDKTDYATRERVTCNIKITDRMDNPVVTNFSVSVTDMQQAVPPINEKNILTEFRLPEITIPDSLPKGHVKPIQYGIEVSGKFSSLKGKDVEGIITFYQQNANNVFAVITNSEGRFYLNHLPLSDSAVIGVQAKTLKGKPGRVTVDSTQLMPPVVIPEPLLLEVKTSERQLKTPVIRHKAILLKEVTVTDSRLNEIRPGQTYMFADYKIDAEWIANSLKQDLISVLQARIPSFRVVESFLRLGPTSSFSADGALLEPLVVIDGIIVNSPDGAALQILSSMSPRDVEKIEVLKNSSAAAFGSRGANGVIAIYTKKGAGLETEGNYDFNKLQKIKVAGYSFVAKFVAPDYSNPDADNASDMRATIYWNPDLTTDSKKDSTSFSFYTSDASTKFRIVIEGISDDGTPFHVERVISTIEK